jgi:hypothetical protein
VLEEAGLQAGAVDVVFTGRDKGIWGNSQHSEDIRSAAGTPSTTVSRPPITNNNPLLPNSYWRAMFVNRDKCS